jgi:hypothetical protein
MGLSGPGPDKEKPITILKRPDIRMNKEVGLGNIDGAVDPLDLAVAIPHSVVDGRGKSPSVGPVAIVHRNSCEHGLDAPNSMAGGEVADRRTAAVY